jgi:hypothetical protein
LLRVKTSLRRRTYYILLYLVLEHKHTRADAALLTVFCTRRFFPKSLCSSDLKLCFGWENSLSTFGFIMALSKLAMTSSGFVNGFNSGLFLYVIKKIVMFLQNLPEFYFSISAFSLATLLINA